MKNYISILSYLSVLIEWEIFQTELVEKIKTHILWSVTIFFFFRKSFRLWDSEEEYGRAGRATDDVIRLMPFTRWVTKARNINSVYVILTAVFFSRQQWLSKCASIWRYTYITRLVSFLGNSVLTSTLFLVFTPCGNGLLPSVRANLLLPYLESIFWPSVCNS